MLHLSVRGPSGPAAKPHRLRLPRLPAIIGRSRRAEIRLPDTRISASHARIFPSDDGWFVEDLGSINGTRLGGRPLAPHEPRPLGVGQSLEIAEHIITRVDPAPAEDADLPGDAAGTETLAERLVREVLGRDGDPARHPVLHLESPGEAARAVLLPSGSEIRIGRDPGCEVPVNDTQLSRHHLVLRAETVAVEVRDPGSKNGASLNGELLTPATAVRLRHGDQLAFGDCTARFEDPAERWLAELDRAPEPAPLETPRNQDEGRFMRALLIAVALAVMTAAGWALIELFS